MLSEKQESILNRVNNLIFIIYALLILEGALRKWLLPQLSSPLFFIKDPFLLYIYWLCFYHKLFPKNSYFTVAVFLALLFYVLMALQSLLIPYNILGGIYGWRTYFLYLPTAFIIGKYFTKADLIKVAKFTCLIAIPIAVLTYLQYRSPLDSYINKNVGIGESQGYTVLDEIVRPSGTFSFTTGHANFVITLLLMLLFNFFLKKEERFLNPIVFYVVIFAFFSNLAVSGSRGLYVGILITLLFLLLASFILLNKRQGYNIFTYLCLGSILVFVMFNFVFDKELDIIMRRQEMAEMEEGSIVSRMFSFFIDINYLTHGSHSFLGYGLGLSSGGGAFIATGTSSFLLAETEWARNILEAGVLFGASYILYRIFLSVYVFNEAIKSTIKSKNPMPLVFIGYILPVLLIGPITGNGTANVYNWLFVGFAIAMSRIYAEDAENRLIENEN